MASFNECVYECKLEIEISTLADFVSKLFNLPLADWVNKLSDPDAISNKSILLSWLDAVTSKSSILSSNDSLIKLIYSLTAYCVGTVSSPYKPCEFNNVVLLLTSCNTTPTATPFLLNGPIALRPAKLNEFASIVTSPVNWLTAKKSPIFKLPILSTVE